MDREILFRGKVSGKRLNKGEWIEGNLVHQLDCYGKPCDKYFILNKYDTNDYEIGEPIHVDPATVGQFTGLCDKNGVKIFEGDIVELVDDGTVAAREWDAAFGKHHEICWVKQDMQDFFGTVYIGFEIPLCACSEYMAVIGNIHDTSDLVEEEAE